MAQKKQPDPKDVQQDLERVYQRLFSTADGKIVLEDLARECFIYESTLPGQTVSESSKDAMLINEGNRRVFLRIIRLLRGDLTEMMKNFKPPQPTQGTE